MICLASGTGSQQTDAGAADSSFQCFIVEARMNLKSKPWQVLSMLTMPMLIVFASIAQREVESALRVQMGRPATQPRAVLMATRRVYHQ